MSGPGSRWPTATRTRSGRSRRRPPPGITVTIVIDFIHVTEYLQDAAWCLFPDQGDCAGGKDADAAVTVRLMIAPMATATAKSNAPSWASVRRSPSRRPMTATANIRTALTATHARRSVPPTSSSNRIIPSEPAAGQLISISGPFCETCVQLRRAPEAHTVKSASGTVRPGQPVTGASAITLAHQSAGFGEPVGAIAAPSERRRSCRSSGRSPRTPSPVNVDASGRRQLGSETGR